MQTSRKLDLRAASCELKASKPSAAVFSFAAAARARIPHLNLASLGSGNRLTFDLVAPNASPHEALGTGKLQLDILKQSLHRLGAQQGWPAVQTSVVVPDPDSFTRISPSGIHLDLESQGPFGQAAKGDFKDASREVFASMNQPRKDGDPSGTPHGSEHGRRGILPPALLMPTAKRNTIVSSPKQLWTAEEDNLLLEAVKQHGLSQWRLVAASLPGRVPKQCRDRYRNHLCPQVKKGAWTPAEDAVIYFYQQRYGNLWAEIAKHLPGRTDLSVKNRYYSCARKQERQLRKMARRQHELCNSPPQRAAAAEPTVAIAMTSPPQRATESASSSTAASENAEGAAVCTPRTLGMGGADGLEQLKTKKRKIEPSGKVSQPLYMMSGPTNFMPAASSAPPPPPQPLSSSSLISMPASSSLFQPYLASQISERLNKQQYDAQPMDPEAFVISRPEHDAALLLQLARTARVLQK